MNREQRIKWLKEVLHQYPFEESVFVTSPEGYKRRVCPECANHEQLSISEVNNYKNADGMETDCKNLFFVFDENGKIQIKGQCCCYSKEHK